MKILDKLTELQQKRITSQFQSNETLPEIQKFLAEECDTHVTTRTIRSWFSNRGTGRIFYGAEMSQLKTRQAEEKRTIQASADRWTRQHLINMINDRVLTGEQVADMITGMNAEMVEAAWENYMYKPQLVDE